MIYIVLKVPLNSNQPTCVISKFGGHHSYSPVGINKIGLLNGCWLHARCAIVEPADAGSRINVAVAESAPQADTWSVCVICTTVGQLFNWYRASRGSLGDSWASCV